MFDVLSPDLISLSEASRLLPGKPHPSTLWRWHTRGVPGVRLQTIVVGGRRYVNREALQTFSRALTATYHPVDDDAPDRDERTEQKLQEAGLID